MFNVKSTFSKGYFPKSVHPNTWGTVLYRCIKRGPYNVIVRGWNTKLEGTI